jgi:flagellar motor protein MotB
MRTFVIALSLLILSVSGLVFINAVKLPVKKDSVFNEIGQVNSGNLPSRTHNADDASNAGRFKSSEATDRARTTPLPKVIEEPEPSVLPDKEIETEIVPINPVPEEYAAAEAVPQKPIAAVSIPKERIVAILDGEIFNTSQVPIDRNLINEIQRVVKEAKAYPDARIVVEGHTDNIPVRYPSMHFTDNLGLSIQRATNTANLLVQQGISRDKISVVGYGDTRPVATNGTESGRVKNRRVEIKIISND